MYVLLISPALLVRVMVLAGLAKFTIVNKKKLISRQLGLQKNKFLNEGDDHYKFYLNKQGFLMVTLQAK